MPAQANTPTKDRARLRTEEEQSKFFESNLAFSIMVLANLIARITTQNALVDSKLSLSEWRVLRVANIFGPLSAADIIATIGLDKTTVSRMITRLHEAQLIKLLPNPSDRRQTLIALTVAGTRLHDRIAPVDENFDRSFESLLSAGDLAAFREVMRKLRSHAVSLTAQLSTARGARKGRSQAQDASRPVSRRG